jgi:hypothetical protein
VELRWPSLYFRVLIGVALGALLGVILGVIFETRAIVLARRSFA